MRLACALLWCAIALGSDACPPTAPTTFTDACAAVKDSVFASLEQGECGLCAPGTTCSCTWHVTFSGPNEWSWQHSDYAMSGSYTCNGMELTAESGTSWSFAAQYDPATDQLTWDGVVYGRE